MGIVDTCKQIVQSGQNIVNGDRFAGFVHFIIFLMKVLLSSHGILYLSYLYSCCFRCRPIAISLTNSKSFVIFYLGPCQLFSIKCFKPRNLANLPHARENMGVKWTKLGERPTVMSHSTYRGEGENIDCHVELKFSILKPNQHPN